MSLSQMLSDYLREFDTEEEWAKSDKFGRAMAASLEGFTSPSDAVVTSFLQKYGRDSLANSLDSHYVRKALKDAPKLVQRTLQLTAIATRVSPTSDVGFYVSEATRCYIHGFWAASVALSRSALEQGLKETVAGASGFPVALAACRGSGEANARPCGGSEPCGSGEGGWQPGYPCQVIESG